MSTLPQGFPTFVGAEPAWEVATLYPPQGAWSVEEYLNLTDSTNRLIEYTDGRVEFLAMPTTSHQLILAYLHDQLRKFVTDGALGLVVFAALRVQVARTKFREPDIVFAHKDRRDLVKNRFWTGANLVMEIVSDDQKSRERDLVEKRSDYAAAGIEEYWIVDPDEGRITVLELRSGAYETAGEYKPGDQAASPLLKGFAIDVAAAFKAGAI